MTRLLSALLLRFGKSRRQGAAKARRPRRLPLRLEALEDRTTPTVLFTPLYGAETTTNAGTELNDSPGTNIYMIYWGSYWNTSAGAAMATNIQNSVNGIFWNSPYLDSLHQYGVPYRAFQPAISNNHIFNYSDPSQGFNAAAIQNTILDAIYNKGLPEADTYGNRSIYFVVTPPGINSDPSDAGGYHTSFSDNHNGGDSDQTIYGWIGSAASSTTQTILDNYTYVLSHETAEAMTDPFPNSGIRTTHGASWTGGGDYEICDAEAQNYIYRLNSYRVNSYWSTASGAYLVQDGNNQIVTVNGRSGLNANLIINGDQLANHNDTITLDTWTDVYDGGQGVRVTENGEVFQFDSGTIRSVTVNTGDGTDTVNVLRTLPDAPVTINNNGGGSSDVVNFGTGGSMAGIQGTVSVSNGPSYTHVNIDDSADSLNRSVSISNGGVSVQGAAAITFGNTSVNTLTINGGSGNNTYTVAGSQAISGTVLNTGSGVDTVNVQATSYALNLNYQGGGRADVANLGSGGSVANIQGTV
jgi:hypothetical protein